MTLVNGVPAVEFSLRNAVLAGVDEIVIVVGYRAGDIINHFGTGYDGTRVKYVIQADQRGLVHAIECAREMIDGDDFMLLLGDEILINPKHHEMVAAYKRRGDFITCGLVEVDNRDLIKKTYTIIQDGENAIFRLVEKPRQPLNNFMGTGDCVFSNAVFGYIEETPVNPQRGEKEMTDLIQCAIDDGMPVRSFIIADRYANINTGDDLEQALSLLKNGAGPL
jgi:dTDP-glucose pyrophosphorylase